MAKLGTRLRALNAVFLGSQLFRRLQRVNWEPLASSGTLHVVTPHLADVLGSRIKACTGEKNPDDIWGENIDSIIIALPDTVKLGMVELMLAARTRFISTSL